MAIDFPASPTLNQAFSSGNVNYVWDGTKWTASVTGGISLDKIEEGNTSAEVIDTGSDGRFVVTTEGSERLRVDSSGRLGIGTTPVDRLHVAGAPSPEVTIRLQDTINNKVVNLLRTGSSYSYIGMGATEGALYSDTTLSIAADNSNPIKFCAGGGEAARIDSSKRLLVGTSSARTGIYAGVSPVQINDNGSARNLDLIGTANSPYGPEMLFIKARSGTNIIQNGDYLADIKFIGYDGAADRIGATISAIVDGTPGANDMPGRLVFSTTADGASSPTERMRITNDGRVGVNTTNYVNGRFIVTSDSSSVTNTVFRETAAGSSSVNTVAFFRDATIVGTISTTNTATAYNTSSDYRLKENVAAVTDGIIRLQQLKPSRFNFIADLGKTVDGFIAHEVQTVVPEAITGEKDAVDADGNPIYQGIDQSKLVPLLTAALQEAIGRIETLEAAVTALQQS